MNREIKFMGKRIDTGEWIYGSLLILITGHYIVPAGTYYNEITDSDMGEKITVNALWEHNDFYKVIPKTVGQYTGLKDRNGKEIYEGDIIKVNGVTTATTYGIAKFGKTPNGTDYESGYQGFYIEWITEKIWWRQDIYFYLDKIEVIGNVYENPELLEVQNE